MLKSDLILISFIIHATLFVASLGILPFDGFCLSALCFAGQCEDREDRWALNEFNAGSFQSS